MTYTPSMVCAQVLWDSLFFKYRSSIVSSTAEVEGFEALNAVDWRDFSLYRPLSGTQLKVTIPSSTVDTFVVWPVAGVAGTIRFANHYGTWVTPAITLDGSGAIVWTDIVSQVLPAGDLSAWFSGAAAPDIRAIAVGAKLQFPIGQWSEINPPNLTQGLMSENLIAINGSILARNIRRTEKQGQIDLEHLDAAWVRSTWDPFAAHASRYAFFHRWDPTGHPNEVAFTVANEIQAPKNTRVGRMSATMPTRFLT